MSWQETELLRTSVGYIRDQVAKVRHLAKNKTLGSRVAHRGDLEITAKIERIQSLLHEAYTLGEEISHKLYRESYAERVSEENKG